MNRESWDRKSVSNQNRNIHFSPKLKCPFSWYKVSFSNDVAFNQNKK